MQKSAHESVATPLGDGHTLLRPPDLRFWEVLWGGGLYMMRGTGGIPAHQIVEVIVKVAAFAVATDGRGQILSSLRSPNCGHGMATHSRRAVRGHESVATQWPQNFVATGWPHESVAMSETLQKPMKRHCPPAPAPAWLATLCVAISWPHFCGHPMVPTKVWPCHGHNLVNALCHYKLRHSRGGK